MKNIVSIFIFAAMLCSAFTAAAREIVLQNASPALLEKITRIDRVTHNVFRLRKNSANQKKLMIILKKNAVPELKISGRLMQLQMPDDRSITDDPELFQTLVSALILSTGCRSLQSGAEKAVPQWLCTGLRHRLDSYRQNERFLHGIYDVPAISALYASDLLPDVTKVLNFPYPANRECRIWYTQISRFLLETAADYKLLQPYAKGLLTAITYADENKKLERFLSAALTQVTPDGKKNLSKIFWNPYNPEPAERKLRFSRQMLSWQLPVLDKENNPTGKYISCKLSELPGHLQDRPDADEQRRMAAMQIRTFSSGCTYQETILLQRLAYLIYNKLRHTEALADEITKLTGEFISRLQTRKKNEDYLFDMEIKHVSASKNLQTTLRIKRSDRTISAAQMRFLLETEKTYSD